MESPHKTSLITTVTLVPWEGNTTLRASV